jgi:hypothetical protein
VEDTWASRDLLVLEAIVSAFNDPERFQLRIPELTGLCGLPEQDVVTALRALLEYPQPPEELTYPIIITDVTERARRWSGNGRPLKSWPGRSLRRSSTPPSANRTRPSGVDLRKQPPSWVRLRAGSWSKSSRAW